MIAFGCSITDAAMYERAAGPGIRLAAEPDSEIVANAAAGSIFRSYNLLMESVAGRDDLEALVLVHQDAEIRSRDCCARIRAALRDPAVGLVGCVGALGVRTIAWWEGSVTWASFSHRFEEYGGGEVPALTWTGRELPAFARTGEVDALDGFFLVLSPWVVRNVRFDESLGQLHGYDFDFALQVRAAGRTVATADIKVLHHHSLQLVSDPETWIAAHMRVAEKWEGRMPGVTLPRSDWKQRARRAEAEASLTRTESVANMMQAEARLRAVQRELAEVTGSRSWRLTRPLRRLAGLRRRWG